MQLVYIAPGSDAQARIYLTDADYMPRSMPDYYRSNPQAFKEIGLIDHKGSIRCLEDIQGITQDLKDQVPLMAGTVYPYDDKGHAIL